MTQQLDVFLASFSEDKALQEHFREGMSASELATVMKQAAGFDFSAAELIRHQCRQIAELSDAELEEIAPAWPVHSNELKGVMIACAEV